MTNRHVIGSGKKVNLQIETATGAKLSGDVIYVSREDDFAIIKVNGNNYPRLFLSVMQAILFQVRK